MAGPGSLWLLLLEVPQAGSSCAVQTPGARSSPTETPGLTRAAAGNSLEPGGILLKAEDATPCSQSKEAAFEYTVLGLRLQVQAASHQLAPSLPGFLFVPASGAALLLLQASLPLTTTSCLIAKRAAHWSFSSPLLQRV